MSIVRKLARKKPARPRRQIFIVTAAQNNTDVHKKTWATLKNMVKYYSQYYPTELKVIRSRYKNPTSQGETNKQKREKEEVWDPQVMPYILKEKCLLNSRIMVLNTKVQWASNNPLQRLDPFTKDKSGIVGHGSRALRSISVPQHKHPKVMLTTGACTVNKNYSDTLTGDIGEFNHCLGAVIVEIEGETFYFRELTTDDDGCIIDLDMEFSPTGWRPAKRAQSLVTGDIHVRWKCDHVIRATFDAKDSIMKLVRPHYLALHDVLDFHTRNHHHKEDWLLQYGKHKFGIEDVEKEVNETIRFINRVTSDECKTLVVSSNHDRAMAKWFTDPQYDFRKDPVNSKFYARLLVPVMDGVKKTNGGIKIPDPFILYAKDRVHRNVRFLEQGESFVIGNVEHGFHGDQGANGARGTTRNLSSIGVKVNKGHSHTAEIVGGCYSAGTSANKMEYEKGGPSSHSHAHILQYANGKRTIIFIVNGRYCLPRARPSTWTKAA